MQSKLEEIVALAVTSDIPMWRDPEIYSIYIILRNDKFNSIEIRAVAKVCNTNYLNARKLLVNKKTLLKKGDAYEIQDALKILSQYDVDFEVAPPYPYSIGD